MIKMKTCEQDETKVITNKNNGGRDEDKDKTKSEDNNRQNGGKR